MRIGDRVRITDIGQFDQFFSTRKEYIGHVGTLLMTPQHRSSLDAVDFYYFDIEMDDIGWTCFAEAAIEPDVTSCKMVTSATVEGKII